jgi:hypothetical protein
MRQRPTTKKHLLPLLLLLSLLWLAPPASAQDGEAGTGITLSAKVGFDNFYKTEFWLPVHVTAANSGPPVEGQLSIAIGSVTSGDRVVYDAPISLPTQSNKRVSLFVTIPRFVSSLTIELLDNEGRVVGQTRTSVLNQLSLDTLLYGVVTPDPGELDFLENVTGGRSRAAVAFLDIADLPSAPSAWSALDILVFNDVDSGQLTVEQLNALQDWVSTGGQLVVTGGPGWQKSVAALSDMLPVTVSGSESVDDLPALAAHFGLPFRDPGPYVVATSTLRRGELLLHQEGLPLLARQGWGRGAVYFLALDPKLAPLLDWDGSEQVWAEIATAVPPLSPWSVGLQNSYAAATAVTSLPSLALPSVLQLVLFLFIYVVMIGPVNYFVLKRLNRLELAWAIIPTLVLIFSGFTYATGFQLRGNDTIINQMSIAYGQIGSAEMRVQSLIGLYSPQRRAYDLALPAETMVRPFDQNFGTLNGSGNIKAISRANEVTITDVQVDVSDIETFVADSYQPAIALSGEAALDLAGNSLQLDVSLQNNSDTALENVILLLGSTTISLGDLAPGENLSRRQPVATAPGASPSTGTFGPSGSGAGSGASLTSHAEVILGTSDYYNDRDAFPRWQLLQALEGNFYSTSGSPVSTVPGNMLTLIAWSDQKQLDIALDKSNYNTLSTTLYLLAVPLSQNITSSSNLSIPFSLLNWQVLAQNGVGEPNVENLYLYGDSWLEVEYTPWPEFQAMNVHEMAIALEPQDATSGQLAPEIRLWDWQQALWVTIEGGNWGQTEIANPTPYLSSDNAIRIRLQNKSFGSADIRQVYPVLTGILE